eukprot:8908104-Pyramimonas_sp.AAC.2
MRIYPHFLCPIGPGEGLVGVGAGVARAAAVQRQQQPDGEQRHHWGAAAAAVRGQEAGRGGGGARADHGATEPHQVLVGYSVPTIVTQSRRKRNVSVI